jgi:hypothetical protein
MPGVGFGSDIVKRRAVGQADGGSWNAATRGYETSRAELVLGREESHIGRKPTRELSMTRGRGPRDPSEASQSRGRELEFPRVWRVSEWLAATLEMSCRVTGCGFESRALRIFF